MPDQSDLNAFSSKSTQVGRSLKFYGQTRLERQTGLTRENKTILDLEFYTVSKSHGFLVISFSVREISTSQTPQLTLMVQKDRSATQTQIEGQRDLIRFLSQTPFIDVSTSPTCKTRTSLSMTLIRVICRWTNKRHQNSVSPSVSGKELKVSTQQFPCQENLPSIPSTPRTPYRFMEGPIYPYLNRDFTRSPSRILHDSRQSRYLPDDPKTTTKETKRDNLGVTVK